MPSVLRQMRRGLMLAAVLGIASPLLGATGTLVDGTIVAWGDGSWGEFAIPSGTYSAVGAGGLWAMGLKTDGTLAAWGYTSYNGITALPSGTFSAIAVVGDTAAAIRTNGSATLWGRNDFSQGSISTVTAYKAIALGPNNSYLLTANGSINAYGYSGAGALSTPSGTFKAITEQLAIRTDGTLAAWGGNSNGLVTNTPVGGTYVSVARGSGTNYAVSADGYVTAWGSDLYGQVTNAPTDGGYISVASTSNTALALRGDGSIVKWGYDIVNTLTPPVGIYTSIAISGSTGYAIRGATSYTGDLRVFGTGSTAILNRSVNVSGNVTIETPLTAYNSPVLSAGGDVTVYAGADLPYGVVVSAGGKFSAVRTGGPGGVGNVNVYALVTSTGPLWGDADVYLAGAGRYQFGLTQSPAFNGALSTQNSSTLAFSGTGTQSCTAWINSGTIRLTANQALASAGSYYGGDNYGTILLNPSSGGTQGTAELTSSGILSNHENAVINARNALIQSVYGTINDGGIAFTGGQSDVVGKLSNTATGILTVTNGAQVTFNDDVVQNGTMVIRKLGTQTSSAIFLGTFSGSGGFTGGGTAYIEGDLAPGNSPADVLYDGDVVLGPTAKMSIDIGGTVLGSTYDHLTVTGAIELSGTLDAHYLYGFSKAGGPVAYNLITAGSITGDFSKVIFPDPQGWSLYRTPTSLSLVSFSVVPEPGCVWLVAAAGGLLARRRR
jgi:hypothetical protein